MKNDPKVASEKDRQCRADLWIRTDDGQELWCDVSIPEPGCRSYLKLGSAREAGVAARKAESNKLSHWNSIIHRYGKAAVKAVPIILESTGFLGKSFEAFLKTIESVSVGPSRAKLISQISVTLMKCNVDCVREAGRKAFDAL